MKILSSHIKENQIEDFEKGLLLPVMEEFYSIQGEGIHTGKPAWFIRIGGCDVGCEWCDVKESWNPLMHPLLPLDDIINKALIIPSKYVVITGGEPLQFNLNPLCERLHKRQFLLFLETSGSCPLTGDWEWICLSPKKNSPPLPQLYDKANELKIIVSSEEDLQWAKFNAKQVNSNCNLLLQPEWSVKNKILPVVVDFILNNPQWRLSLQTHKYIGIP